MTPEEKKEQMERYYDSIRRASEHHHEVMKQLNKNLPEIKIKKSHLEVK